MFGHAFTIIPIAALATIAAAAPNAVEIREGQGGGLCDTGPNFCCNSVESSNNIAVTTLAGLLGIALSSLTGNVGLTCDPITAIGGSSCTQQPVCCIGNNYSGLIVLGCSPLNL